MSDIEESKLGHLVYSLETKSMIGVIVDEDFFDDFLPYKIQWDDETWGMSWEPINEIVILGNIPMSSWIISYLKDTYGEE